MTIFSTLVEALEPNVANIWDMFVELPRGVSLVLTILLLVSTWRVYQKAGCKGWLALVPYYSTYTLYKISWGNGWYFLVQLLASAAPAVCTSGSYLITAFTGFMFPDGWYQAISMIGTVLSVLAFFVSVVTYFHLALAFKRNFLFALGLIFLNPIFMCILAFGPARYVGIARNATVEDLPVEVK